MAERGRWSVSAPAILTVLAREVGFLTVFRDADYRAGFLPARLHIYRRHAAHLVYCLDLRGRCCDMDVKNTVDSFGIYDAPMDKRQRSIIIIWFPYINVCARTTIFFPLHESIV